MKIKSFQGGYDKNFSYLVWCEKTKFAAIVDPSVPSNEIIEQIEKLNLTLVKIFITHTHFDHIQYLEDFIFKFPNIEICCHEKSINLFKKHNVRGLINNETVFLGELLLIAMHTPGHYHDSICYWLKDQNILFTGDTMFVGRPGRVKSKTSNIKDLYHSIYNEIFSLPEKTIIYSGHNYGYSPTITIKKNREISNFFSCISIEEFIKEMEKFESNYK
tara:strand:- start:183 stop:833 length:651 start_codon:yes stop_codon:yes gene_type:complete